jgi:hypothetical protein
MYRYQSQQSAKGASGAVLEQYKQPQSSYLLGRAGYSPASTSVLIGAPLRTLGANSTK